MPNAMSLTVEFSSGIPVYRQIINAVYAEIGKGNLREGDRLPTIKELTEKLGINPNTIAKAYRELDIKGIITSRRGDGSFVSAIHGSTAVSLTDEEKRTKLDELFGRVIAEAKSQGIAEEELIRHMAERMRDDRINHPLPLSNGCQ
jgi:GntR family transcriptional regulator